jgi:hypothetical protein
MDLGGWTLCLASTYTEASSALFQAAYATSYADDPFSYFDYCAPTGHSEYLIALGRHESSVWILQNAALRLGNVADSSYVGTNEAWKSVRATEVEWLIKPTGFSAGFDTWKTASDYVELGFWTWITAQSSLSGSPHHGRGEIRLTGPGQEYLLMGSACYVGACNSMGGNSSGSNYASVSASVGIQDENGWEPNSPTAPSDRTLVFYR